METSAFVIIVTCISALIIIIWRAAARGIRNRKLAEYELKHGVYIPAQKDDLPGN